MAFSLKAKIFSLFGRDIKDRDSYKDSEGKGFVQRYNELMAEEYDEFLAPYIDNLIDYTLVPQTALEKFIPYLEEMFGGLQFTGTTVATRRKILQFAIKLYQVKGTKKSYEMLYRLLGFNSITIIEHGAGFSFDSATTFDDPFRHFDSAACPTCSDYTLNIYGSVPLTDELHKMIFRAIDLCEPINARLRAVYYNDTLLIADDVVSIFVDENGDLVYDNVAAPEIVFTLDENGDLFVSGPGQENYQMNQHGDIIFNQ